MRKFNDCVPEQKPEVPAGQKLRRHGYRWRTVRSVSIWLKPVVLKVKVPRWLNTTTGEEFEQSPLVEPLLLSKRPGSNLSPRETVYYLLLGVVVGDGFAGAGVMFQVNIRIFQVSPSRTRIEHK
jgi:hypothetical protein